MRRLINKIKYSIEDFFEDAKEYGVNKFFASLTVLLTVILFLCVIGFTIGLIGGIYMLTQSVTVTIIAAIIIIVFVCVILSSSKESIW